MRQVANNLGVYVIIRNLCFSFHLSQSILKRVLWQLGKLVLKVALSLDMNCRICHLAQLTSWWPQDPFNLKI